MQHLFPILFIFFMISPLRANDAPVPAPWKGLPGVIVTPLKVVLADQVPENGQRVCVSLVSWHDQRIAFIEDIWDCSLARKLQANLNQETWVDLTPDFYFSASSLEKVLRAFYADALFILIDRE